MHQRMYIHPHAQSACMHNHAHMHTHTDMHTPMHMYTVGTRVHTQTHGYHTQADAYVLTCTHRQANPRILAYAHHAHARAHIHA